VNEFHFVNQGSPDTTRPRMTANVATARSCRCHLKRPRDIRLYPNRRLYDPVVARYIRYDDIFALVRDGIPFTIRDTAQGKDQTHKVFTDLLIRAETGAAGGGHVFTEAFLRELIRLGARESAPLITAFLNHSIGTLLQPQPQVDAEPDEPTR